MRSILDGFPLRLSLVLVVVLVLQTAVIPNLQVQGVSADLMLLLSLAASLADGPTYGAITAFCAGVSFDLVLQTPFGLSALVYTLVAWTMGVVGGGLGRSSWRVVSFAIGMVTAIAVPGYALAARVFGEPWLPYDRLWRIMAVEAGFNAVLAPVAIRVCAWTVAGVDARKLT